MTAQSKVMNLLRVPGTIDGEQVMFDEIKISTELVPLPTNLPQPDPDWSYTDKMGHTHKPELAKDAVGQDWVKGYPTLIPSHTEPSWCEMCQEVHSLHDGYFCHLCDEKISPKTFVDPSRVEYIQGRTSVTFKLVVWDDHYDLAVGEDPERLFAAAGYRFWVKREAVLINYSSQGTRCEIDYYPTREAADEPAGS